MKKQHVRLPRPHSACEQSLFFDILSLDVPQFITGVNGSLPAAMAVENTNKGLVANIISIRMSLTKVCMLKYRVTI